MKGIVERLQGGVVPAMATPLKSDGTVHLSVVEQLVNWLIGSGVSGLFLGGTTGEGLLLPLAERMRLYEVGVLAAAGRVPVLVHAGTHDLSQTLQLAKYAQEIKADGVVVITPTFYNLSDNALADYFEKVAAKVPAMPFFLYDIPQMAVNGVSPALLARLIQTIPHLAGVKSSRADAQLVRSLIDVDEQLAVYAGNERIGLGLLALGARGLISGLATAIPEPFVAMTNAVRANDWQTARQYQRTINRLLDEMPAARIGGIKAILQSRGFAVGMPLSPLPSNADGALWQRLETVLTHRK